MTDQVQEIGFLGYQESTKKWVWCKLNKAFFHFLSAFWHIWWFFKVRSTCSTLKKSSNVPEILQKPKKKSLVLHDFKPISHSPEIRGLCLMKWPSKVLQNLSSLWNTKSKIPWIFFFLFHFCATLFFPQWMPWSMST